MVREEDFEQVNRRSRRRVQDDLRRPFERVPVRDDDAANLAARDDAETVCDPRVGKAEGFIDRDERGVEVARKEPPGKDRGNFQRRIEAVNERAGVQIRHAAETRSSHAASSA